MKNLFRQCCVSALFAFACAGATTAHAIDPISLVGLGEIPSTATDFSGITDNRLIAFGSGIAYTGFGNRFVAVTDRADAGATTDYFPRLQYFDITVNPTTNSLTPTLVDTKLLVNENGVNFTGRAGAFDTVNPANSLRLDPEGIRVGRDGNYYITDELGPYVWKFNQNGQRIGQYTVPDKFLIANPNSNLAQEGLPNNTVGRVANRGMEGLAISPDGSTLFGMMQNPLLQDGGLNGVNNRILKVDLATGTTTEYVYQMENKDNTVSEVLAINDQEFLVVERDKNAGNAAAFKRIYRIDLSGATDVSAIGTTSSNGLPTTGLPGGVTAVSKTLLFDILDPAFGLAGATLPEKFEGLAWGPDLADGRHLLLMTNDGDLPNASKLYAFALTSSALPGFSAQSITAPEAESGMLARLGLLFGGTLFVVRRKRQTL